MHNEREREKINHNKKVIHQKSQKKDVITRKIKYNTKNIKIKPMNHFSASFTDIYIIYYELNV